MRFERQFGIGVLMAGLTIGGATLARGEDTKPAGSPPADRPEGRGGGDGRRFDPQHAFDRFQETLKDLNLSDDQKSKIKDIIEKSKGDLQSAMKDTENLEPRERMQKIRETMSPVRDKLMDVLDETQRDKLREKMQAAGVGGPNGPRGFGPGGDRADRKDGKDGKDNDNQRGRGERRERPDGARGPGGRPDGAGGPPQQEGPGVMMGRLRDNLDKLNLNDDQKKKADALLSDTEKKLRDLKSEADKAAEQTRGKFREAMQNNKAELDKILTDDQKQKLREIMPPPRRPEGDAKGGPPGKDGGDGAKPPAK